MKQRDVRAPHRLGELRNAARVATRVPGTLLRATVQLRAAYER
jgi:hypothetical protein